jgi:hypothetical protein
MIDVQVLKGCAVRGAKGQGRIESVSLPWVRIQWANGQVDQVDSKAYRRGSDEVFEDFEILTLDKGWQSLGALVGTKSRQQQLIVDLEAIVGSSAAGTVATQSSALESKTPETAPVVTEAPKLVVTPAEFAPFTVRRREGDSVEAVQVESAEQLRALFDSVEDTDAELMFFPQHLEQVGTMLKGLVEYEDRDGNVLVEDEVLAEAAKHNPFKKWKKIGFGPRADKNDQGQKWKCKCSNYSCRCIGIGRNSDAAPKRVNIDRGYKKAYNRQYKPWRSSQEPYKPSRA